MNLQPFTIEAYERGEEVVYRDGTKPDEVIYFKSLTEKNVRSVSQRTVYSHYTSGLCIYSGSNYDLMIKPKTVNKYRNEYESGIVGAWKNTKEQCKIVGERNGTNGYDKVIAVSKGEFIIVPGPFTKNKLVSIQILKP